MSQIRDSGAIPAARCAGPGTSVRACVLTPAVPSSPAEPLCSKTSVTLASSTAAPPEDGTSVFYNHNPQEVSESSGVDMCSASLDSGATLADFPDILNWPQQILAHGLKFQIACGAKTVTVAADTTVLYIRSDGDRTDAEDFRAFVEEVAADDPIIRFGDDAEVFGVGL